MVPQTVEVCVLGYIVNAQCIRQLIEEGVTGYLNSSSYGYISVIAGTAELSAVIVESLIAGVGGISAYYTLVESGSSGDGLEGRAGEVLTVGAAVEEGIVSGIQQ